MENMASWEHARLLKPCKFLLSQPNSIILELGKILLSWKCSLQDVRRNFLWASSSDPSSPSLLRREGSQKELERKRMCHPPPALAASQPSTSAEPRMAIPISEYRELCRALETLTASQSNLAQEMASIRACQEQMLATQAQQAAILRQLQAHFDLPQAVEPSTSTPLEPHSQPSDIKFSLFHFLTYSILFETCGLPQSIFEFDINQEVPLPPFNYSHSKHIEDNAQFGWGV
ncbi:hypothetical protein AAG906_004619 [Vitis piasezkii]